MKLESLIPYIWMMVGKVEQEVDEEMELTNTEESSKIVSVGPKSQTWGGLRL